MLKYFSRAPADQFRTRSRNRDSLSDRTLLDPIEAAIRRAIGSLEAEKEGLRGRMDDALSRAAIVAGNDVYEHDTRDAAKTSALTDFEHQVTVARARLLVVDEHIAGLNLIHSLFRNRFSKLGAGMEE
jgi:hypothetical protein